MSDGSQESLEVVDRGGIEPRLVAPLSPRGRVWRHSLRPYGPEWIPDSFTLGNTRSHEPTALKRAGTSGSDPMAPEASGAARVAWQQSTPRRSPCVKRGGVRMGSRVRGSRRVPALFSRFLNYRCGGLGPRRLISEMVGALPSQAPRCARSLGPPRTRTRGGVSDRFRGERMARIDGTLGQDLSLSPPTLCRISLHPCGPQSMACSLTTWTFRRPTGFSPDAPA